MRDNDTRPVATPLIGSGVLGAGAYGSMKLNNLMNSAGFGEHLKFNPAAIKAINEFARATPDTMRDPSDYIFRYSNLANRASNAKLFTNDPRRAWELFTNDSDVLLNSVRDKIRPTKLQLKKLLRHIEKLTGSTSNTLLSRIIKNGLTPVETGLKPIKERVESLEKFFNPLQKKVNDHRRKAYKRVSTMIGAHEAELAQSPLRAIIRLFNEAGGNSSTTNSLFNTTWAKPEEVARHTAMAIDNYRNCYNPDNGKKPFKSLAEAFVYGMSNVDEKNIKYYRDYLKFFENVKGKTRKEILQKVRKILAPRAFKKLNPGESLGRLNKTVLNAEVKRILGDTPRWVLNPETGKLEPPVLEEGVSWFNPKNGIKTVADVKKLVKKSPALAWLASQVADSYRGAEFGHMLKAFRLAHLLRNGKLRLALGAGSVALGGLGMYNLGKNQEK